MSSDSISANSANGKYNPYFFILGCPRSGTTLLQRMMDAHPQLGVFHETHWIPGWFLRRQGLSPEGMVMPELIPRLLENRHFQRLEIAQEEMEPLVASDGSTHFSCFVSGIFDLFAKRTGKPWVGDKTPHYARHIPTLHQLWPTGKFIHLIRDGRNVALSWLHWNKIDSNPFGRIPSWKEDRVTASALWWEFFVLAGRIGSSWLDPKLYCETRYESLVDQPEEECKKIGVFLDVPYDDGMVRFHEGRTREGPGLDAKHAWLPVTAGLRDWRTQMTDEEVERFEAAAGPLLDELGYTRGAPSPSPDAMKHADRLRGRFVEDLRSMGWIR